MISARVLILIFLFRRALVRCKFVLFDYLERIKIGQTGFSPLIR